MDNAEIAMEPARAVKEYKSQIKELETKNDEYAKIVGRLTVERDWLSKKVKSFNTLSKRSLVESKLNNLSIAGQCRLIGLNRSNLYYKPIINTKKTDLIEHINDIYEQIPIYGAVKVQHQLLEDGYSLSVNTVSKYRKELEGNQGVSQLDFYKLHSSCLPHVYRSESSGPCLNPDEICGAFHMVHPMQFL